MLKLSKIHMPLLISCASNQLKNPNLLGKYDKMYVRNLRES